MFLLVYGGSASGKSAYAEQRTVRLHQQSTAGQLIYLAAMKPYSQAAQQRIRRHRRLRAGKGFRTVERYTDLYGLCQDPAFARAAAGSTILLECMSNLTANEIFEPEGAGAQAADAILKGIEALRALVKERQVRMVQRDIQNRIREHPDPGKRSVSRKIRFRAGNVFVSQWQSADFSQLRGHGEEIGKRIVPGRDPASVRVVQIIPEDQRIRVVSRFVFHQHDLADNGGVHGKRAAARIPHDQVIAVQKVAHIDIRGDIAPHVGKKLAAHRRRVADHQTVFSRSSRLRACLTQEQQKGRQNSSESLHWSSPFSPQQRFSASGNVPGAESARMIRREVYSRQSPVSIWIRPNPSGAPASRLIISPMTGI